MIEVHFFDNESKDKVATVGLTTVPSFAVGSYLRLDKSNPYDVHDVDTTIYRVMGVETSINAAALDQEDYYSMRVFVAEVEPDEYEYDDVDTDELARW